MSLKDSFMQSYSRGHEANLMGWIYKSIALGMAPWNPGKITAWIDEAYSVQRRKLTFEIELLPNLKFVSYPDYLRYDLDTMAFKIAEEAFKFYRYRPALPVDDHIVLGED